MNFLKEYTGLFIAIFIMVLWASSLYLLLGYQLLEISPFVIVAVLFQTHLFTGVFITAHDSIHGTVHGSRRVNSVIGYICCLFFAFNNYSKLTVNHHLHHRYPGTEKDPDYYNGGFFTWYFNFLKRYITIKQLVLMAIAFNVLKLFFAEINIVLFWVVPSLLSTFQLFYFGTYLPHRGEHEPENKHRSRTFLRNHFLAFVTCYFFGYHYQHHHAPYLPWWKLYKIR